MSIAVRNVRDLSAVRPWALKNLPPYPPVAKKLMQLTFRGDVPFLEIQALLNTDAALAADVLRLANSPLLSVRAEIKSVLQAVVLLGLDRIKALVTTLALRGFVTQGARKDTLHQCWRQSLATALICERLARFFPICKQTCYTAGLLHDIGRLALLAAGSSEYERVLSTECPAGFDLLKYEKSLFEIDHCDAGRWILEQWEFPRELRSVVSLHHTTPTASSSDLLRIAYVGWQTASLLGYSMKAEVVSGGIDRIMEIFPPMERRHIVQTFDHLAGEVAVALNAVECSII